MSELIISYNRRLKKGWGRGFKTKRNNIAVLFLSALVVNLLDLIIHSTIILNIPVRPLPGNDRREGGPGTVAGILPLESWLT